MERKTLRKILLLLIVVLLVLLGIRFGYDYIQNKRMNSDNVENAAKQKALQAEEPLEVQPVVKTEIQKPAGSADTTLSNKAEDEKIERYTTGEHVVKKDESFSMITGYYWNDIFLWPDLYIRNSMRSDDPDLIYPDEIITIYNRLGKGNVFSTKETGEILEAYLEVYKVYKKLGAEKNNSVWSLLWCAARYDHNFLETYKNKIDPEDRAMAQKYIDEEGFLD
jgi:hypothetical protein